MTLNQIENEAHAIQEILKSFLSQCRQASSQTCLFQNLKITCFKYFLNVNKQFTAMKTEWFRFLFSVPNFKIRLFFS